MEWNRQATVTPRIFNASTRWISLSLDGTSKLCLRCLSTKMISWLLARFSFKWCYYRRIYMMMGMSSVSPAAHVDIMAYIGLPITLQILPQSDLPLLIWASETFESKLRPWLRLEIGPSAVVPSLTPIRPPPANWPKQGPAMSPFAKWLWPLLTLPHSLCL